MCLVIGIGRSLALPALVRCATFLRGMVWQLTLSGLLLFRVKKLLVDARVLYFWTVSLDHLSLTFAKSFNALILRIVLKEVVVVEVG